MSLLESFFAGMLVATLCIFSYSIYALVTGSLTLEERVEMLCNKLKLMRRHNRRANQLKLKSSRRAQHCIRRLNQLDLDYAVEEFVVDGEVQGDTFLPLAYRLSRNARIALHFPKHSPANERVVSDWIQRHWPEGLRTSHKATVLPWAVRLTFVKSLHEQTADAMFQYLQPLVDSA